MRFRCRGLSRPAVFVALRFPYGLKGLRVSCFVWLVPTAIPPSRSNSYKKAAAEKTMVEDGV